MQIAQRHHPFVTYFFTHGTWLGMPQMMRVRRRPATHDTGLCSNILEMVLIPDTLLYGYEVLGPHVRTKLARPIFA